MILLLIVVLIQVQCSSTKSSKQASSESSVGETVRDASSFEKAIVVKSIREEYEWVEKNYPGSKMLQQSLSFKNKKPYDILSFTLSDGSKRDFYFDVSKFYGKGF